LSEAYLRCSSVLAEARTAREALSPPRHDYAAYARHIVAAKKGADRLLRECRSAAEPWGERAEAILLVKALRPALRTISSEGDAGKGKVFAYLPAERFQGGARYPIYRHQMISVRPTSPASEAKAIFVLPSVPDSDCRLIVEGSQDDMRYVVSRENVCDMRVTVNGKVVFEGPNTFPRYLWGAQTIRLPQSLLRRGDNTLAIANTDEETAVESGDPKPQRYQRQRTGPCYVTNLDWDPLAEPRLSANTLKPGHIFTFENGTTEGWEACYPLRSGVAPVPREGDNRYALAYAQGPGQMRREHGFFRRLDFTYDENTYLRLSYLAPEQQTMLRIWLWVSDGNRVGADLPVPGGGQWRTTTVRIGWLPVRDWFPIPELYAKDSKHVISVLISGVAQIDDVRFFQTRDRVETTRFFPQSDLSRLDLSRPRPCVFENEQELSVLRGAYDRLDWVREAVDKFREWGRRYAGQPDKIAEHNTLHRFVNAARSAAFAYAVLQDRIDAEAARDLLLRAADKYDAGQRAWKGYGGEMAVPAHAYDLIYSSGIMSPEQRRRIETFLRKAYLHKRRHEDTLDVHNRAALAFGGLTAIACALKDPELIEEAINRPYGLNYHLAIGGSKDGLWHEGMSYLYYAMGDTLYGMTGYLGAVEAAYHQGINFYENDAFRRLLDTPFTYAFPDLSLPGHGHCPFDTSLLRYAPHYERLYARTKDPKYAWLLNTAQRLGPRRGERGKYGYWNILNILLPELPQVEHTPELPSANFTEMGHAVLRGGKGRDFIYALLDYGPIHSHAHPDKLNLVLFANGKRQAPDGTVGYGVESFLTSSNLAMGHNTVIVDEEDQAGSSMGEYEFFIDAPRVKAVCGLGSDAYEGVAMSRTLVLFTGGFLVDLFRVASREPHRYDWFHHNEGGLKTASFMKPQAGVLGYRNGYQHLTDLRSGLTGEPWQVQWVGGADDGMRLSMLGARGTQVIGTATRAGPEEDLEAVVVRRYAKSTIYASLFEPYKPSPRSGDARRLELQGAEARLAPDAAYAIAAEGEAGRAYVLRSYHGVSVRGGGIGLRGEMGVALLSAPSAFVMLVKGTELTTSTMGLATDREATVYLERAGEQALTLLNLSPYKGPVRVQANIGKAAQVNVMEDGELGPLVGHALAHGLLTLDATPHAEYRIAWAE